MWAGVLAVAIGAALGALLRWGLALGLNALWPAVPPGTWVANVVGGYLIGVAMVGFTAQPQLSGELKLFIVTGFLGGLTTFSTFSAEVMRLLLDGRLAMAFVASMAHLIGSLLATWAGVLSAERWWRS